MTDDDKFIKVSGTKFFLATPTFRGSFHFTRAALAELIEDLRNVDEPEEFWTPEPVIGWRVWTTMGHPPTILGGLNGAIWRKRKMVASHVGSSHGSSPYWGCRCGINAAKTTAHLGGEYGHIGKIFGQVALTGVIHEYELGYRASVGEMVDLYIPKNFPDAKTLTDIFGSHYRVSVKLVNRMGEEI